MQNIPRSTSSACARCWMDGWSVRAHPLQTPPLESYPQFESELSFSRTFHPAPMGGSYRQDGESCRMETGDLLHPSHPIRTGLHREMKRVVPPNVSGLFETS